VGEAPALREAGGADRRRARAPAVLRGAGPATPPWARRAIYAALAYFIVPFDLIPDFLPGIGYTDDAGTLLFTLFAVSAYVSRDIKIRARAKTTSGSGSGEHRPVTSDRVVLHATWTRSTRPSSSAIDPSCEGGP